MNSRYRCKLCGKSFASEADLNNHDRSEHEKMYGGKAEQGYGLGEGSAITTSMTA